MNSFTYVCPKGELAEDTEKFLSERLGVGIDLNSRNYVEYTGKYRIVRMRSWDVPQITEFCGGYGITGKDIFEDYRIRRPGCRLREIESLGYGKTTISALGRKPLKELSNQ